MESNIVKGDNFYVEQGQILNAQAGGTSSYGVPDVIWTDPETQGKVYVGNIAAAKELKTLTKFGITNIINCQDVNEANFHESNPEFTYLRFPIGTIYSFPPFDIGTDEGVVRYFNVAFGYIEEVMEKGQNVLIHCLAGAHRAGTTATSWLLYKENLSVTDAISLAKSRRSVIDPKQGDFSQLLEQLRSALNVQNILETVRSTQNVISDSKQMITSAEGHVPETSTKFTAI